MLPSPNLPTLEGAIVYPGQVLLEGTNLSEGRGTTRPFELFGAPFLEPGRILEQFKDIELPGVILRTACFEPTFHKWAGELCRGFQLHVTDRRTFKPYYTTLALLAAIRHLYPEQFAWRQPPYEYETVRLPFDLLTGDERHPDRDGEWPESWRSWKSPGRMTWGNLWRIGVNSCFMVTYRAAHGHSTRRARP